jgi:hypothetical protein
VVKRPILHLHLVLLIGTRASLINDQLNVRAEEVGVDDLLLLLPFTPGIFTEFIFR